MVCSAMPFEDRLGEALRRTGDGFTHDNQDRLVETGLARGRRRLARRRTAVAASSVLTLVVAGLGGAYAGGLLRGDGGQNRPSVAAPQPLPLTGDHPVSATQMIDNLTSLLPEGDISRERGRGTEGSPPMSPTAWVVFDDGKGTGLVSAGVHRVDPESTLSKNQVTCPAHAYTNYDTCATKTLADGSRFMLLRGYEYHEPSKGPKCWQAVRLAPDGVLVSVQEWNSPAEKGEETTRKNPPLSAAQLTKVATAGKWLRVGRGEAMPTPPSPSETDTRAPSGGAIRKQLVALLPKDRHFGITEKGGDQSEFAYIVADDGKGKSLIQINVQQHMGDVVPRGQTSTLPDGTRIGLQKGPGEKGVVGAVMWTADIVHPDGFRVVISAFNTGGQHDPTTRSEPVLTVEEMKKIALDDSWRNLR